MDCNMSEMRGRNRGWNDEQKVSKAGMRGCTRSEAVTLLTVQLLTI